MLSPPHNRDSKPDGVLLWEVYQSANETSRCLPHVVVTSRAARRDRHGNLANQASLRARLPKRNNTGADRRRNAKHGCASEHRYRQADWQSRRFALVVEQTNFTSDSKTYPITMRATLADPYCA